MSKMSMPSVRSSAHYIWSTSCTLGHGATGTVYKGQHQKTGESVAVKTFTVTRDIRPRPMELLMREFEVLNKLNHKNIVRMLAMEEEIETKKKVLIMELCTGGSLYSILDDPQNSYGLEEAEFLCVLKDLSAGMKYLRDNSIVHRDLKPGNIMKFISEDGKSVYKLIDFGAARELEDDQPFLSLYGTEEYLHPDLYERAVLKHNATKQFKATVDLWSIGVTLYHVATGSLPFRPYGGRKNKDTMFYITTQKASGVVSGVQHSEGGSIEWGRELPITCLLNQGLQKLVTSLLAGILECQDEKMWGFDKFFESVTDIVSRKTIHVFYMNEGKEITLYLQPDKNLTDIKGQIAAQVDVPSPKQMILYDKTVFNTVPDYITPIANYPKTTSSHPLILLHNEKTDIKDLSRFGALSTCFPMFHTAFVNIDHDAALSKNCCSVAHAVKRLVERLVRCRDLLLKAPKILLSYIFENVLKLCSDLDISEQRIGDLDRRLDRLEKSCTFVTEFANNWPNEHQCQSELWNISQIIFEKKQLKEQVNQKFKSLQTSVSTLKQKVLISGLLQKEWDQAMSELDCLQLGGCIEKANTYVNEIRHSWQQLLKHKQLRDRNGQTLTFQEERFHLLEKAKVQLMSKKFVALLQDQCVESCHQASQKLDEWYSGMQAAIVQCKCLEEDTSTVLVLSKSYSSGISEAETSVDNLVQKILSNLKNTKTVPQSLPVEKLSSIENGIKINRPRSSSSLKKSSLSEFCIKLDDLTESHSDLRQLVNEHDSLIDRLIHEKQTLNSVLFDENGVEN